jgi:hypothetical protein
VTTRAAERSRDRDSFVALVLGALSGGGRLHAAIDAALPNAESVSPPRPLGPSDYALLGLLGFHHRLAALLDRLTTDDATPAALEERRATVRSSFTELLR